MTSEPKSEKEALPLSPAEMIRAASVVVTSLGLVVKDLRDEVKSLKAYGQRSRFIIGVIGLLFIGLAFGLWQGHLNDNTTTDIQKSIVATQEDGCKFGNDSRIAQKKIWDGVFLASAKQPRPGESEQERLIRLSTAAEIEKLVAEAYAIRDCTLK